MILSNQLTNLVGKMMLEVELIFLKDGSYFVWTLWQTTVQILWDDMTGLLLYEALHY